jgi:hypothetical protein
MPDSTFDSYAKIRALVANAQGTSVAAMLREAAPADQNGKPRVLPTLWFDEITPCLDAKDFVQGVLLEGGSAVVYGESNAGKTFWVTDLALHVAAGAEWNGRRVEQGGVVYCALEGGTGFRNRVAAWRADQGLDDGSLPFMAIPSSLNLLDPEADTPLLIEAVKAAQERMGQQVKLIIIDTLARAFAGGNENASEDMGLLVQNMDLIRSETSACVLFVHHSGKDAAKGARGHSSLRAALDTEIEVKAEEGSDLKSATTVKQRELRKGDVFAFRLETVVLGQNRHGEDVTTCLVRPGDVELLADTGPKQRLSADQQAALAVLNDLIASSGATGHTGTPAGTPSVPEAWWRDRFYDRAKPGAPQDTKKKAFARAAEALVRCRLVGMDRGRVWIA